MQPIEYTIEELVPVVAGLTEKYTSKESTSITYEKAQQLMEAVIYCINECNDDRSVAALTTNSLTAQEAYEIGYQSLMKKLKVTQLLYNDLVHHFQAYGCQAYDEVIIKGMPAFFLHYDHRFQPQNHILTLDYPLLISLEQQNGIDRIAAYLEYIKLEQQFLQHLSPEYIYHVLNGYHGEYQTLLINISSIVYRNLLGSFAVTKKISTAKFSTVDKESLIQLVKTNTKRELKVYFEALTRHLIKHLYNENEELEKYLCNDLENFCVELKHAVEHNCLPMVLTL